MGKRTFSFSFSSMIGCAGCVWTFVFVNCDQHKRYRFILKLLPNDAGHLDQTCVYSMLMVVTFNVKICRFIKRSLTGACFAQWLSSLLRQLLLIAFRRNTAVSVPKWVSMFLRRGDILLLVADLDCLEVSVSVFAFRRFRNNYYFNTSTEPATE